MPENDGKDSSDASQEEELRHLSVCEQDITRAMGALLLNIQASFVFTFNDEEATHSSLTVSYDFLYEKGGIKSIWTLTSHLGGILKQISLFMLAFATVDGDGYQITLRNELNTDLAKDIAFRLTHDESTLFGIPGISSTQIAPTKEEQLSALHEQQTKKEHAAYIAAALEAKTTANANTPTNPESENSAATQVFVTSNFTDWYTEGQNVYANDNVHAQLWTLHQMWSSSFELLNASIRSRDLFVCLQSRPWVLWDVQDLYFGDTYNDLYADPDHSFATSLFPLIDPIGTTIIRTVSTNTYTSLSEPQEWSLLMHVKRKLETSDGYLIGRISCTGQEQDSNKVLGPNQEYLKDMLSAFADSLWEIRLKQHL